MKILRMQFRHWALLLIVGLALTGSPFHGQAMSLFMGSEEPKPAPLPPKPAAAKPQTAPGQPGAKPSPAAPPTGFQPPTATPTPAPQAPAGQPGVSPAKPASVGQPPAPATSAPTEKPAPAPPVTAVKPGAAQPAVAPAAHAGGAATEPPKPAAPAGAPPVQAVPGTPVAAAAPAPTAVESLEGYSYDPKSRRDPFQTLTLIIKAEKKQSDMPPLQRVQLSDLKLLGIIWGGYGYYGLVQTPDGKGYTVKEGMLMGTNNGVVTAISNNAIIVSEPGIDITGKKTTKEVEILLRPKEVS